MKALILALMLTLSATTLLADFARPLASIVRITQGHGTCTGFVVDAAKGQVLTARHCVSDDPDEGQLLVDGQPTTVLKVDEALALLSVPAMSKPPLDIRKDRIKVGDSVVSYGYGYGWMQVLQRHVASWNEGDVFLDAPLAPGMSGGPTIDANGEVVGLNQATTESIGRTCGVDELRAFLKNVR